MKKTKPKKVTQRGKRPIPPSPTPATSATTTAPPQPTPAAVVNPRRVVARMRQATATPAQRRGSELVRFLKIHAKHPYGTRGENAIVKLAREVGHMGNAELNAPTTLTET